MLVRPQPDGVGRDIAGEHGRRRIEDEPGTPQLAVEALVVEFDRRAAVERGTLLAAACAPHPAHLEQIEKVARERKRERQLDALLAEITHAEPLMRRAVPEENAANDVDGVLRQDQFVVEIDVGIGEVDGENDIVVPHVRAEQQRLQAVELELEARQMAGVAVEHPVLPGRERADVAGTVEYGEGVPVLEHAARLLERTPRRNVEGRFLGRLDSDPAIRRRFSRHISRPSASWTLRAAGTSWSSGQAIRMAS